MVTTVTTPALRPPDPAGPDLPDVASREAFVGKLSRFRASLPVHEQRYVDAIVFAVFGGNAWGDVAGYGWTPGPEAAVYTIPLFYRWGGLWPWEETPWAAAYRTVPRDAEGS
jgi:hypothetical protein